MKTVITASCDDFCKNFLITLSVRESLTSRNLATATKILKCSKDTLQNGFFDEKNRDAISIKNCAVIWTRILINQNQKPRPNSTKISSSIQFLINFLPKPKYRKGWINSIIIWPNRATCEPPFWWPNRPIIQITLIILIEYWKFSWTMNHSRSSFTAHLVCEKCGTTIKE